MDPRLRRMALLLERIPSYEPTNLPHARFHSRDGRIKVLHIQEIDAHSSSVRLRTTQDIQEVIIPLDCVKMIWREPDSGLYHVSLDGSIVETSTRELQFYP